MIVLVAKITMLVCHQNYHCSYHSASNVPKTVLCKSTRDSTDVQLDNIHSILPEQKRLYTRLLIRTTFILFRSRAYTLHTIDTTPRMNHQILCLLFILGLHTTPQMNNIETNKQYLIQVSRQKFSLVINGLTKILQSVESMKIVGPDAERNYYESQLIILETLNEVSQWRKWDRKWRETTMNRSSSY